MRTTITLDDDVEKRLRQIARRTNQSFKELVNETLRRGLAAGAPPQSERKRFIVECKSRGFRPGVDLLRLNQFSDELEIQDFLKSDHSSPETT